MPPHSRIDLPPEVLISIQRVLSLHQDDPLDNLGTFEPVETLNVLFPDGQLALICALSDLTWLYCYRGVSLASLCRSIQDSRGYRPSRSRDCVAFRAAGTGEACGKSATHPGNDRGLSFISSGKEAHSDECNRICWLRLRG
jgi:hypothetical protein